MRFVIPEIPPSQNRYAGRQNVWEYRNEKQRWKQMVSLLCRPKPKQPICRATVKLTYEPRRIFSACHGFYRERSAGMETEIY